MLLLPDPALPHWAVMVTSWAKAKSLVRVTGPEVLVPKLDMPVGLPTWAFRTPRLESYVCAARLAVVVAEELKMVEPPTLIFRLLVVALLG